MFLKIPTMIEEIKKNNYIALAAGNKRINKLVLT